MAIELYETASRALAKLGASGVQPPYAGAALALVNAQTGKLGASVNSDGVLVDVDGNTIVGGGGGSSALISVGDAEAGSATTVAGFSALRVRQAANAAIVDSNDWIVAEKTILESRSTSGPIVNGVPLEDAELQLPVEAGSLYRIAGELLVIFSRGEAGGWKWNVTVPPVDKLTLFISEHITDGTLGFAETHTYNTLAEIASTGTTFTGATVGNLGSIVGGSAVTDIMLLRGFLDGGTAGGLFKFLWSPWTGGGDVAANLYPGSWIGLKKVS